MTVRRGSLRCVDAEHAPPSEVEAGSAGKILSALKNVPYRNARTCKTKQGTPTICKNQLSPLQILDELFRCNDGRKVGVDTLKCRAFVFGSCAACGVADDDRQVAGIACCARIAFNTPVQVNARQDDDFDLFEIGRASCRERV